MVRHRRILQDLEGIKIVGEDNDDMLGTYAMIDPQGMVYTNLHGRYRYSDQSAIDIGFSAAWRKVIEGFSELRFDNRGGNWDWIRHDRIIRLPVVQGGSIVYEV